MRRSSLIVLSGLALACALPMAALAESLSVVRQSSRNRYDDIIAEAAQRFALPPAWIRAVMRAESDVDPHAISPKGAIGLMQVMPGTWAVLRIRHRLGNDPYDPHDNILAGAAYIRELFDRYGSPGWIAAYNAGPGRYEASLNGRPLPIETRAYVATIAPVIDGSTSVPPVRIAAADPLLWTRAPLFIARQEHRPAIDPATVVSPNTDTASTEAVRDASAIVQPSGSLFVRRRAHGEVQ